MSMNPAFRSHLMQQFAAAAGRQSRPPLVMAQVVARGVGTGGDVGIGGASETRRRRSSPSEASSLSRRTSHSVSLSHQHHEPSHHHRRRAHHLHPSPAGSRRSARAGSADARRSSSTIISEIDSSSDADPPGRNEAEPGNDGGNESSEAASAFQSVLRSRRSVSNFAPLPPASATADGPNSSAEFIRSALTRAVLCAVSAPNHHRTEPFTFRRMTSPSDVTDRLADIAYRVSVCRMRERARGSEGSILAEAERKREKWRSVPAFLVATVGGQPCQQLQGGRSWGDADESGGAMEEGDGGGGDIDQLGQDDDAARYAELPLSPPRTERQLEDYASACAAVQNVLLSLHSEGVGSKWATGPVVRTKAFRELVGVRDDEAVVALVMAGLPKRVPREPRRRRELAEDVLLDL